MTRHLLIDTDTASDDAVALVMALRHPEIRVEAVTVVAGNVPVEQGVQNALYTAELCGRRVDVYQGAGRPILRPLETAQEVHGGDGMGDFGLPLGGRHPAEGHAADVIIERIRRCRAPLRGDDRPRELTLVCLGPLTNVATALLKEPSIAGEVASCVVMGGTGKGPGNVTPVAEYNVWADPEAAKIVFESGLPLTLVGWDISCASAVIDARAEAELRAIGSELADFAVDIQGVLADFARDVTHLEGFDLPDPIAMAVAIEPRIAETEAVHAAVVTGDGLARGQTIFDWLGVTGQKPNVEVVRHVPRERFLAMLHDALRDESESMPEQIEAR